MSESEYVDRTPLDDPAWVIALVEERDALRARVRELEGAVEAARVDAIRKAVEALPRSPLFDNLDMVNIDGWHIQRPDLLAALLPAPAPGRDIECCISPRGDNPENQARGACGMAAGVGAGRYPPQ